MPNKTLSIIIVNYRSERHLFDCISSARSNAADAEIIVINNDDSDLSKVLSGFSGVRILASGANRGFGAGANAGFLAAGGDILLFLNPDTQIMSGNVEAIIKEFESDPRLAILGPSLIRSAGDIQPWSAGREAGLVELAWNNLRLSRSRAIWENDEKTLADWVSGTAMFVRRKTFEKLNGFDEKFFMYFEDMDLCKRARMIGEKVVFFPGFKVKHLGGESYAEPSVQKKHYYDSLEYFFGKHRPPLERWIVRAARKLFFS